MTKTTGIGIKNIRFTFFYFIRKSNLLFLSYLDWNLSTFSTRYCFFLTKDEQKVEHKTILKHRNLYVLRN